MKPPRDETDWFGVVLEVINPALVMGLVGSLTFFLIDLLYRGEYDDRLRWTMFFFVFGAVMASRVSLVLGSGRGLPYALLLGAVTFAGTMRFASGLGMLGNAAIILIIAASSFALTRDTTWSPENAAAGDRGLVTRLNQAWQLLPGDNTPPTGRTHGVWVVGFAAAALPVFGLGQSLIAAGDANRRRSAFVLMTVYIACALGLLLTTALVTFRGRLRARRLKLPPQLAGLWLGTGLAVIALAVGVGMLVPRPQPEFAWLSARTVSSVERSASKLAPEANRAGKGEGRGGGEQKSSATKDSRSGTKDDLAKSESDRGKSGKDGRQRSEKAESEGKEQGPESRPESSPPADLPELSGALLSIIRIIVYLLVVIAGLFVAVRLLAGLNETVRNWLARLTNRGDGADAESTADVAPVFRRFTDYSDPFASGVAERQDTATLVTYTFAALEAWARDQGEARRSGETAHEFAARLGRVEPEFNETLSGVIDLYTTVAYTRGRQLPVGGRDAVAAVWQVLSRQPALARD